MTARSLPAEFTLASGNHATSDEGLCLMEAVAYIAGEPHSDQPKCASPVLTRFGIRLNDRFSNEERQLLAPLIPRLVGTRSTKAIDRRRMYSLVDSSIREISPMGLEVVGWKDLADRLRALAPITDKASAIAARPLIEEIRDESRKRKAAAYADAADAAYAYAYAAYAAADADAAAAYAAAAADARKNARRPVVLASIAAFSRAIDITEAQS